MHSTAPSASLESSNIKSAFGKVRPRDPAAEHRDITVAVGLIVAIELLFLLILTGAVHLRVPKVGAIGVSNQVLALVAPFPAAHHHGIVGTAVPDVLALGKLQDPGPDPGVKVNRGFETGASQHLRAIAEGRRLLFLIQGFVDRS